MQFFWNNLLYWRLLLTEIAFPIFQSLSIFLGVHIGKCKITIFVWGMHYSQTIQLDVTGSGPLIVILRNFAIFRKAVDRTTMKRTNLCSENLIFLPWKYLSNGMNKQLIIILELIWYQKKRKTIYYWEYYIWEFLQSRKNILCPVTW